MKKNLLLLMLALLLPAFMYGQEQTVSGTVLDTYKMGVPGASIVEKGTTNGTITDFDGNYTLTVSNKNATLVFSFIGYKTQEIPVAGKAKVDVILQENAEQLDEVVVTGYGGSQKRATLTTSISKLDNAVLENAAMANAGQSLQGTVSGLRVVNISGQPGKDPNIVLRGGATMTGKDNGFMSCGSTSNTGFTQKNVQLKIFAPAGTKALYAEPFSECGQGYQRSWDGKKKQTSFSYELETIIQRGSSFQCTNAKANRDGSYELELLITGQDY